MSGNNMPTSFVCNISTQWPRTWLEAVGVSLCTPHRHYYSFWYYSLAGSQLFPLHITWFVLCSAVCSEASLFLTHTDQHIWFVIQVSWEIAWGLMVWWSCWWSDSAPQTQLIFKRRRKKPFSFSSHWLALIPHWLLSGFLSGSLLTSVSAQPSLNPPTV